MASDYIIRCRLMAALIVATAIALSDASARPARSMRVVVDAHPTRAVVPRGDTSTHHATVPRALAPLVLAAMRDSIVAIALLQLGTPYVYGGTTPDSGFDCSGLVQYALSQVHLTLPRTAMLQSRAGAPVDRATLERGDLVAFGDTAVTHIGIYVGFGRFIHASSVAGKVIVSPLDRTPSRLIRPMRSARRLIAMNEVL